MAVARSKGDRGRLAETVVEAIRVGVAPDFTQEDEAVVHRFATELLQAHGVSQQTLQQAVEAVGSHGVVDLVGILGYYRLISMTIKAFEIGGPADSVDAFP